MEPPKSLNLPLLLVSKDISILRKWECFLDDIFIEETIKQSFATSKTVHPEAVDKICEQLQSLTRMVINCLTFEADRVDNGVEISDEQTIMLI